MKEQITPELLSIQQAAQYLGYNSPATIKQMLRDGRLSLPVYARNGTRVIRRRDLNRYIDNLELHPEEGNAA